MEIKYRYYKEKFLELYNQGYSPIQMEKEIPVESATLKKWHIRLNLELNKFSKEVSKNQVIRFDKDSFMEYYDKGFRDLELANKFKISRRYVCKLRKELGLQKNGVKGRTITKEQLVLDEKAESALIGCLLGDGYLQRKSNKNTRGTMCHSTKQLDYLKHLHTLFKIISAKNISYQSRIVEGKTYECARFNFLCNPYLNKFHEQLYSNNKKIISEYILNKYNAIALAYHYMDDGTKRKSGYMLCTYGFDLEDVKKLNKILRERFNLKTTICKNKTIYIKKDSVLIFNNLVLDYIIPSMEYKMHKSK